MWCACVGVRGERVCVGACVRGGVGRGCVCVCVGACVGGGVGRGCVGSVCVCVWPDRNLTFIQNSAYTTH